MALTANRELAHLVDQSLRSLPVKSGAHIYKGALVGLSGGYARGLVAGDTFAGLAYEEIHNSGADAERAVRVYTQGDFQHPLAAADRANNFAPLYAADDATLTIDAGGNSFVGYQVDVTGPDSIVLRLAVMAGSAAGAGSSAVGRFVQRTAVESQPLAEEDFGKTILVTGGPGEAFVTLPKATADNRGGRYTIVHTAAPFTAVWLTPWSDESTQQQIGHGFVSTTLSVPHDAITLVSNGDGWDIESAHRHNLDVPGMLIVGDSIIAGSVTSRLPIFPAVINNGTVNLIGKANCVIPVSGTGPANILLPAGAADIEGQWYEFVNLAANALTIVPDGTDTIDGESSNTELSAAYDALTVKYIGNAKWIVSGRKIAP